MSSDEPPVVRGGDVAELAANPAYLHLLEQVRAEVHAARTQAALDVNAQLIRLNWRIGLLILERQQAEGWGTRVIDRLAADLRAEFSGRGWSRRSLEYMRTFASVWPDPNSATAVAGLPWGHITVLLDKVSEQQAREWYAGQVAEYGWSRSVLTHHISTDRYGRAGRAPNNFTALVPAPDSDLVREVVHDPYNFDFLGLEPGYSERQLEDALIAKLTAFMTEVGEGFAFVGRQYPLQVGDSEYYLDLVFYHLGLRRFVIFELKVGGMEPEHVGKLNFYCNAADDQLRRPEHGDGPTIGILLVSDRDDVKVEYALRGLDTPMAISRYLTHRELPEQLRRALPTADQLADIVHPATQHAAHRGSAQQPLPGLAVDPALGSDPDSGGRGI